MTTGPPIMWLSNVYPGSATGDLIFNFACLVVISSRYKEMQEKNEKTKALIRKRDEASRAKQ